MDFGAFRKAVTQAARETVVVATAVAPAYKAGAVTVSGVVAPWVTPFIAALPADVNLAIGLAPATTGASLFLLVPEFRPGGRGAEIDYTKLGELAAAAYLKKGAK